MPEKIKITVGIDSLDLAALGGLPEGSHVVLFGGPGTHTSEFCYTSAFMNAAMKAGVLPAPERDDVILPEDIMYLVYAKSKEDIVRDVEVSFEDDFFDLFSDEVKFKEFMSDYYASSFAPLLESEEASQKESEEQEDVNSIEIIGTTHSFLEEKAGSSLIILDSLDDLIRVLPKGEENRLLAALRSLQTSNKNKWNSLILSRLTKGVFPKEVEESILSLVDGVFDFQESGGGRKRTLKCRKFTGVTSGDLLDSSFEYNVTSSGLEARKIMTLE